MNDFLGRKIKLGDYVICAYSNKFASNMQYGKVVKFGQKMLTIETDLNRFHRYPAACLILNEDQKMLLLMSG